MKFRLTLFILALSHLSFAQTIYHVVIPATNCYLIPPVDFEAAQGFSGFQHLGSGALIMVNEILAPFPAISAGLTAEALKSKNMNLLDRQEVYLTNTKATLITVTQPDEGVVKFKQMLLFGDDQKTILISGIYPESLPEMGAVIRKSLLSTIYEEGPPFKFLEAVNFSIRIPGSHFKLSRYLGGSLIYTVDGKLPTARPWLIASSSAGKIPIEDQKQYCLDQLKKLQEAPSGLPREVNQIQIDDLQGYEIIADGKNKNGAAELTYQATLFDKSGANYTIAGLAAEEPEINLRRFRNIAKTIKRGSLKTKARTDPTDTVFSYLDSEHKETTAENATYYQQVWKDGGRWIAHSHFILGERETTAAFSDDSLTTKEGSYSRWYVHGQIADSANYLAGKLDGPQAWYFENGQKSEEGIYKAGKPESVKFWREDGNPDTSGVSGEVMPTYKGNLSDYLINTLRYPEHARDRGLGGRAVIQFYISKHGKIMKPVVCRSSGVVDLDNEAFRVISIMPEWHPAMSHNRPIEMVFTMPVTFRLD